MAGQVSLQSFGNIDDRKGGGHLNTAFENEEVMDLQQNNKTENHFVELQVLN